MDLLPLKSVLPKKVYLNNIVVGRQRESSFFVDGKKYEFSFSLACEDYKAGIFFKIKLSDHTIWLSLEELPPLAYFSQQFEGVDLNLLPEDIRPVVLEACFKNVLDVVEEELGVVISIESYDENHPEKNFDDELPFLVNIEGIGSPVRGLLHMEGPSLEFLAALLERSSYARKNKFTSIEVPLYVIIGEETLSLNEFKRLELRDILLFGGENFTEDGSCKVIVGNYLMYDGVWENGTLTLENLMDERVDNEDMAGGAPYEEEEVEDIDFQDKEEGIGDPEEDVGNEMPKELADIPIHVVFEVGQRRLPIKELQSLKAGYTFELDNPVDQPVTIRANGKVIGMGEVLKVGDRVGVRVISFLKK